MKPKTLILVRHAHRDTDQGRGLDNGLSKKGEEQAQRVAKFFKRRKFDVKPQLFSSPKKRCIETITPLSDEVKVPVQTDPLVGEGMSVRLNARAWADRWKHVTEPLTIVCSHGDWIPECVEALIGIQIEISKGGWVELTQNSRGEVQLDWLLQKLPR